MIEIIPNWHPIFVHFTVALLSVSVVLFVIAPYMKAPLKEQWLIVARWSLWFGAGLTVITGLTGLYAYNTVAHDSASHAAMTDHRNWAIATITLFLIIAAWSIVRVRRQLALGTVFLFSIVIAGSLLASTAWRGGEVVYRYGLGVMSLPKAEGEGHAHEHADGEGHGHDGENKAEMEKDHHDDEPHGHIEGEEHGDGTRRESLTIKEDVKSPPESSKDHHDDGHDHKH